MVTTAMRRAIRVGVWKRHRHRVTLRQGGDAAASGPAPLKPRGGGGLFCGGHHDDGCDETFQNDAEEPEGRDRKGNRPGVLRCSYCVKQGNVVSARHN